MKEKKTDTPQPILTQETEEIVQCVSREQITVSTAVKVLSILSDPLAYENYQVVYCDIQPFLADIKATFDGATAPTSTVGTFIAMNQVVRLWGVNMRKAKFLRAAAVDVTLDVTYYGFVRK